MWLDASVEFKLLLSVGALSGFKYRLDESVVTARAYLEGKEKVKNQHIQGGLCTEKGTSV